MDDDELRARNLIRVDPEALGVELPPGYYVVVDVTPLTLAKVDPTQRETLLGVPDPENYPSVLQACDPSHEDYDPAGNDQEATDG